MSSVVRERNRAGHVRVVLGLIGLCGAGWGWSRGPRTHQGGPDGIACAGVAAQGGRGTERDRHG